MQIKMVFLKILEHPEKEVNNVNVNKHDAIHFSGIAVIRGTVEVSDSIISATENAKYGISYHDLYNAELTLDGKTVAKVQTNSNILKGEVRTADYTSGKQDTVVINGSLQGDRDNMTGEYTLNDLKAENEIYAAPVNIYGTKLTRFNLHGSKNLEVGDFMTQEFTYLDPNVNETVGYSFRYNTAAEDLNALAAMHMYGLLYLFFIMTQQKARSMLSVLLYREIWH